jgi:hypothetical protein
MAIRVTVVDTESGETESREITDDVIVVTAGRHHIDHIASYGNGTKVYTIKVDKS